MTDPRGAVHPSHALCGFCCEEIDEIDGRSTQQGPVSGCYKKSRMKAQMNLARQDPADRDSAYSAKNLNAALWLTKSKLKKPTDRGPQGRHFL